MGSHYGTLLHLVRPEDGFAPSNYLEKIFQFPYWLPALHGRRTAGYLAELIESVEIPGPERKEAKTIRSGSEDGDALNEGADAGIASGEEVALEDPEWSDAEIKDLDRLSPIAGNTPRAIKRYFNLYRVLRSHPDIWPLYLDWRPGGENPPWRLHGVALALCNTEREVAEVCYRAFVAEGACAEEALGELKRVLRLETEHGELYDEFVEPLRHLPATALRHAFTMALQHSFHGFLLYGDDEKRGEEASVSRSPPWNEKEQVRDQGHS